MSLHTERFTGRVADYERFRTRFPAELIAILEARCGLTPSQQIADIGAGTGMLAELFLAHGNPVIAVEPNSDMRAACARLMSQWSRLRVLEGTAEQTGLVAGSVGMISAGRAFHWFEPVATAVEFRRILRPGGWIVLASSGRLRDKAPQSVAYEQLLLDYGDDYERHRERYDIVPALDRFFAQGEYFREQIQVVDRMTLEAFIGQTQSLSVTPQAGTAKFEPMQQALRRHFDRWSTEEGGERILVVPNICYVNCGRL